MSDNQLPLSDCPEGATGGPGASADAGAAPAVQPPGTPSAEPTPTEQASARAQRQAATAQAMEALNVAQQQIKGRFELQDDTRVMSMFASLFGGNIPAVYINEAWVAGDLLPRHGAGEVFPPPQRDSADVDPDEIAKVRRVYQRHTAYPQALKTLREQHCVVLRGRPGLGKRAAAIRLGSELQGDSATAAIRELSADDDLAQQVQALAGKPKAVYLVDGLLATQGKALKPLAARTMLDTLRKHDCYLIICARPEVPFPPDLPAPVALEAVPVSAAALVEAHLAYHGSFSAEQVRDALAHPDVRAILEAGLSPARADRLASQLADALQNDRPMDEALRGYAVAVEDDVRRWFDEAADDRLRAFRISLAVFSGARSDAVYDAARALETRLRPPSTDTDKTSQAPATIFTRTSADLLLGARQAVRPMPTDYSDRAMVEVLELEDPNYSPALFKYLWSKYPDLRRPLLEWLCQFAVEASQDLRLRAAAAIGALAGMDFHTLQGRVLRPWAFADTSDPNERRRRYQALGNALGVLIWNDDRAEEALGLLQSWLDAGNDAARWAAARAYTQVGLRYPREAMNQWRRILESKGKIQLQLTSSFGIIIPHPLHMSVVDAIVSLFLRAVELPHRLRPVYEQALEGLSAWVEADAADRNAEQVGLPLFLALTAVRIPPENSGDDPEQWPPAMLTIVGTQPDSAYRRILAGLIRRAVLHADLRSQAIAALRTWVEAANGDEWLEKTLQAVLAEWLAFPEARERERGILRLYLGRWANLPKSPLKVAGRLLANLNLVRA